MKTIRQEKKRQTSRQKALGAQRNGSDLEDRRKDLQKEGSIPPANGSGRLTRKKQTSRPSSEGKLQVRRENWKRQRRVGEERRSRKRDSESGVFSPKKNGGLRKKIM